MKVAVAGAGKVGRFLAEDFAQNGHDVQLLDSNADLVAVLPPVEASATYGRCVRGHFPQGGQFRRDGRRRGTTGDDEDNLVISQLANRSSPFPACWRGEPPEEPLALQRDVGRGRSRLDAATAGGLVEEAVSVGMLVRLLQFDGGHTRLMEVTLDATRR